MSGNVRRVTEATLEREGRDWSGAGGKGINRSCPPEQRGQYRLDLSMWRASTSSSHGSSVQIGE
jgi:hypothetical protein